MTTIARPLPQPSPLPSRSTGRMTYAAYLIDPEIDAHTEWVDGEVIVMPSVSDGHSALTVFLSALLAVLVDHGRLGVVGGEPFQMKSGPDLPGRSPHILFVADAHRKRLRPNFLDGPADLVIEIVSPESRTRDRVHEFAEYEIGGVREYWLVEPDQRSADFFVRGRAGKFKPVPADAGGVYHSKVVTGLWQRVDWLWQRPMPSTVDVLRTWGIV